MLPMTRWLVREARLLEDDLTGMHRMSGLAVECDAVHNSWR